MTSESVIAATGLSRDFGSKHALENVTLEIPPARIVALLGPNGAGKTTLLKLLSGGLEPTQGSSCLFGEASRRLSSRTLQRFSVMLDGEEPPAWVTLKLLLDLEAEAKPLFDRNACVQALQAHDLALNARYGTLSKGQKRWVQSMLCLCSGSELLLMDEPADGLDPAARRELYDRIRTYANDHSATLIVATHLIHDIERIADDVAILCQGKLLLHEDLEQLREEVRFVEVPIGVSSRNLLEKSSWLQHQSVKDGTTGWVRCDHGWSQSTLNELPPRLLIHPFALEEFYLAMTDRNSVRRLIEMEMEVQP